MHIITARHLNEAAARYADAAAEIAAWHTIVKQARWTNFVELRETFADGDAVDGYVIFNVRRNRYRLVTVVHDAGEYQGKPTMGHVDIRSFLMHEEYDTPAIETRSTADEHSTGRSGGDDRPGRAAPDPE